MKWTILSLAVVLAGCTNDPLVVTVTVPIGPGDNAAPPDMSVARAMATRIGGFLVAPTKGLTTSTLGTSATFTVALTTPPEGLVTVAVASSNVKQGTVSPSTLTFSASNSSVPQTVTVTGVDDHVINHDHVYSVTLTAHSFDTAYRVLSQTLQVTNVEIILPGFVVAPTTGLTATAGSATATFGVSLATVPTANVSIGLSSSNTAVGTVSPATLTFTPANAQQPQNVVVTAVDDHIADGDQVVNVVFAASTSTDTDYNGLTPASVSITSVETDVAGITVTPTAGLTTTKAGGTATFTVHLNSQPTQPVTIGLSSSNVNAGTPSPTSLVFTAGTYSNNQTVTVTGVNDHLVTGNIDYSIITAAATSSDPGYNGRNAADVGVTNVDTNMANIILSRTSGLTTVENGGTDSFTIKLSTNPSQPVTIGLTSDNTNYGSVSPSSVVFTNANGTTAQTVTVTGVADSKGNTAVDGNVVYHVVTAAATSSDTNYNGLNASDVTVTSIDDDVYVYGSNNNDLNSMVWCYPNPNSAANCSCNPTLVPACATLTNTLNVSMPYHGGSANFVLGIAGAAHAVYSPASQFATGGALTVIGGGAPFVPALPSTTNVTYNFACAVHGTIMSGNLIYPP